MVLALVSAFGVLAWLVAGAHTLEWERNVVAELASYNDREPLFTATATLAAIGGDYFQLAPFVLVAAAAAALALSGREGGALFVATAALGVTVLVPILKSGFARPPLGSDASEAYFPSGHATGSASVVGAFIVLFWRTRWRWWVCAVGALFVLVYGISLVFRASHYPLDVVAGWCLGVAWLGVLWLLFQFAEDRWRRTTVRGETSCGN
jgi:membrane-associated phospholipid phosphatase